MQLDQRATLAGREVGIGFRYDLMKRVPNTSNVIQGLDSLISIIQ